MATRQRKTKAVREFGDFQTPPALARTATQVLCRLGIRPRSILEPTCGRGAFVAAAAANFPEAEAIIGIDINRDHLSAAETVATRCGHRVELRQGDFFELEWRNVVTRAGAPWLIVGNPPWVTNAELGAIDGDSLPEKSNFHGRMGIEAITGKSNFDISEWMLLRYLDWLEGSTGTIAVLCKTAIARKILLHVWKKNVPVRQARIYKIDAHAILERRSRPASSSLKSSPRPMRSAATSSTPLTRKFLRRRSASSMATLSPTWRHSMTIVGFLDRTITISGALA